MSMRLMSSRFDGTCRAQRCIKGGAIAQGSMIYYTKDNGRSIVFHKECAEAMAAGTLTPSNLPSGHGIVTGATAQPVPAGTRPAAPTPPPMTAPSPAPAPWPTNTPGNPAATGATAKASCLTCTHLVGSDVVQRDTLGVVVGGYICGIRGIAISTPNQDAAALAQNAEEIAAGCTMHFDPALNSGTQAPETHLQRIPESVVAVNVTGRSKGAVTPSTCGDCRHFINSVDVKSAFGWDTGMCAAQGKLLFPKSIVHEAAACGIGDAGTSNASTLEVQLMGRYLTGNQMTSAPTPPTVHNKSTQEVAAEWAKHDGDPREYVTDKPVTEAEAKRYIRAWRKVTDPKGYGPDIFMPIFDGEKLMAAECPAKRDEDGEFCTNPRCDHEPRSTYGSHRPDLYIDHARMLYPLAAIMVGSDMAPLLEGPSGSGKTEAMIRLAYLMDLPAQRIAIKKGTEAYHLAGEKDLIVDPGSGQTITDFTMGRFSAWYSRSCVIVVDEANLKSEIMEFLRPAIDGAKRVTLDEAQGQHVDRGANTFVAFTQNPSWDPIYVGTEPMNAADMDRLVPVWFDLPSPEVEKQIIRAHCADVNYDIPPAILDKIMQISGDIRQLVKDGAIDRAWGIRSNVKVAKLTEFFSIRDAFAFGSLNGMEPEARQAIETSISSVVA